MTQRCWIAESGVLISWVHELSQLLRWRLLVWLVNDVRECNVRPAVHSSRENSRNKRHRVTYHFSFLSLVVVFCALESRLTSHSLCLLVCVFYSRWRVDWLRWWCCHMAQKSNQSRRTNHRRCNRWTFAPLLMLANSKASSCSLTQPGQEMGRRIRRRWRWKIDKLHWTTSAGRGGKAENRSNGNFIYSAFLDAK